MRGDIKLPLSSFLKTLGDFTHQGRGSGGERRSLKAQKLGLRKIPIKTKQRRRDTSALHESEREVIHVAHPRSC